MSSDRDIEVHVVFPAELERELWNYAGMWVAIVDDRVVAVGDSITQASARVPASRTTEPILYKVPGHEARFYVALPALAA